MPWEKRTVEEQRKAFVAAAENKKESISALCRKYGISRKTGYKWLNRAKEGKELKDGSRVPIHQPGKTPPGVEQLILEMRADHPTWGGKTIRQVLENQGKTDLPCSRTCDRILSRNGCIDSEEAAKHKAFQRFERSISNELWQADFKGDFLLKDGTRCYPLTTLDDHSRYCIQIQAKENTLNVKDDFIRVFNEYGLPDALLTDNGVQFSGFRGGYTQFERFLMDLDVEPIHGRIWHPQTQGKIERFHRTMKQEILRDPPANMKDAQKRFDEWRWLYNEVKPHSALKMKPPISAYQSSPKRYHTPHAFTYPEGARVVKVNNWGYLRFGPIQLFLSETMKNTYLEIRPTEHDTIWVLYRNFRIAVIDPVERKLLNRTIRRL